MLLLFINSGLIEFEVGYSTLFCLFSVIDCIESFCMGCFNTNIKLMLEFLKSSFLGQH